MQFSSSSLPVSDIATRRKLTLDIFVENGKVDLEWSRFTRRNVADKDKVVAFIQERHQTGLAAGQSYLDISAWKAKI